MVINVCIFLLFFVFNVFVIVVFCRFCCLNIVYDKLILNFCILNMVILIGVFIFIVKFWIYDWLEVIKFMCFFYVILIYGGLFVFLFI